MKRADALPYVSFIMDDSLNVTDVNERNVKDDAVLVGWQCGFEPLFVAVASYLPGVLLDADEALHVTI